MIEQRDVCPTSGGVAGAQRWNKRGGRSGWCPHCGKWRALTPGGKFKRHAKPEPPCSFCLEPWSKHTESERRSCEADIALIEAVERRRANGGGA